MARRSARVRAVIAWLRVNSRLAWVETIHAPLPSAAACWLNRAVAATAPLTSRAMNSDSIRIAILEPPLVREVPKASDRTSDNDPRSRRSACDVLRGRFADA